VNTKLLLIAVGLVGLIPLARTLTAGAPETVETYYADGTLKSRTETRDGRRNGLCTRFYADGTKRAEGTVEDGEESGKWVFYDDQGQVDPERSGLYDDGRRVRESSDNG
jgi:antitoxin component YwqK of YwqJK toxin-antitoxin module